MDAVFLLIYILSELSCVIDRINSSTGLSDR